MTSFTLSKWAIKRIDRIRRNFLWSGTNDTRAGKYWVNWRRVCRPKRLGGLGILDLAAFNRALRLRWRWFRWADQSKPWHAMALQLNKTEEDLFRACLVILIGDGQTTSFWKDRWLNGYAPQELASKCFKLAWRKNQTVSVALTNKSWMHGLRRINTDTALRQFVSLWRLIRTIQLTNTPDQIQSKVTAKGTYTAKSAYEVQFLGTVVERNWDSIWKAKVQTKCKFFTWLLLQARLPTNDRIIRWGGQADPICQLCRTQNEKITHMIYKCSYVIDVWQRMATWSVFQIPQTSHIHRVGAWWDLMCGAGYQQSANHLQILVYTVWHLWKERCRRAFDNKPISPADLVQKIQGDIIAERLATMPHTDFYLVQLGPLFS